MADFDAYAIRVRVPFYDRANFIYFSVNNEVGARARATAPAHRFASKSHLARICENALKQNTKKPNDSERGTNLRISSTICVPKS